MAVTAARRATLSRWGLTTGLPGDGWAWAAGVLSVLAGALFTAAALVQWRDYQVNAYDMAIFDQVAWNTSHGRWWETSFTSYGNYLGQHFSPILALFALAYLVGAGPLFLMVAQALLAAVAAVPLYAAARRFGLGGAVAIALCGAYLGNAYLHRALAFDFHPETFIALPVFGAAWAVAGRRFTLAAGLAGTTLLFKEDSVFVALALAAFIAWQGGRWQGAVLGTVATAWALVAVLVVMPDLRDGVPNDMLPRYGYLAPGAGSEWELAMTVVTHPWRLIAGMANDGRTWTVVLFLLATAPIALTRPVWLVALIPGLAVSVLSANEMQRALELHYAVQVLPLALLIALIVGRRLRGQVPEHAVATLVLAPALLGFVALSPFSPLNQDEPVPSERHRAALDAAINLVPGGDTVSAQSSIVPRMSQRPIADEFPGRGLEVEWVIVDRYGARSTGSLEAGYWKVLERVRERFILVFEEDGVEVYRNPLLAEPAGIDAP